MQTALLHMKRLNKTEAPIFVLLYVLFFQRQPFRFSFNCRIWISNVPICFVPIFSWRNLDIERSDILRTHFLMAQSGSRTFRYASDPFSHGAIEISNVPICFLPIFSWRNPDLHSSVLLRTHFLIAQSGSPKFRYASDPFSHGAIWISNVPIYFGSIFSWRNLDLERSDILRTHFLMAQSGSRTFRYTSDPFSHGAIWISKVPICFGPSFSWRNLDLESSDMLRTHFLMAQSRSRTFRYTSDPFPLGAIWISTVPICFGSISSGAIWISTIPIFFGHIFSWRNLDLERSDMLRTQFLMAQSGSRTFRYASDPFSHGAILISNVPICFGPIFSWRNLDLESSDILWTHFLMAQSGSRTFRYASDPFSHGAIWISNVLICFGPIFPWRNLDLERSDMLRTHFLIAQSGSRTFRYASYPFSHGAILISNVPICFGPIFSWRDNIASIFYRWVNSGESRRAFCEVCEWFAGYISIKSMKIEFVSYIAISVMFTLKTWVQ